MKTFPTEWKSHEIPWLTTNQSQTHMLHGAGIFTIIYPINGPNVSKQYTIHGAYEPWSILTIWLLFIPSIIRILIMVIINPYEPLDD